MKEGLRFAEAVCEGHPDRLCDQIAAAIVDLACSQDDRALVGVEVAIIARFLAVEEGDRDAGSGHRVGQCAGELEHDGDARRAVVGTQAS